MEICDICGKLRDPIQLHICTKEELVIETTANIWDGNTTPSAKLEIAEVPDKNELRIRVDGRTRGPSSVCPETQLHIVADPEGNTGIGDVLEKAVELHVTDGYYWMETHPNFGDDIFANYTLVLVHGNEMTIHGACSWWPIDPRKKYIPIEAPSDALSIDSEEGQEWTSSEVSKEYDWD